MRITILACLAALIAHSVASPAIAVPNSACSFGELDSCIDEFQACLTLKGKKKNKCQCHVAKVKDGLVSCRAFVEAEWYC